MMESDTIKEEGDDTFEDLSLMDIQTETEDGDTKNMESQKRAMKRENDEEACMEPVFVPVNANFEVTSEETMDEISEEPESAKNTRLQSNNSGTGKMSSSNKRAKRSSMWKYFSPVNEVKKIAACKICESRISYFSTVTNLKSHLQKKHPTVNLCTDNQSVLPAQTEQIPTSSATGSSSLSGSPTHTVQMPTNSATASSSLSDFSASSTNVHSPSASSPHSTSQSHTNPQSHITPFLPKRVSEVQRKQLDTLLMNLFILDFQPFSIVSDSGFVNFVRALNPAYQLPSRAVITKTLLPALYEQCLNIVKEKLSTVRKVCLTTDCWTSKSNDSYLAVTAHFISNDFAMYSVLLECAQIMGSHTSKLLAEEMEKILDKFDLRSKSFIVVTDNASNMKNAVTNYLNLEHFGCFAHTLNLIVEDALKHIKEIHEKVKIIVAHFKRSTLANEKLLNYQKNSGNQNPQELIQDVATRWNSTYFMLQRFVELKDSIKVTAAVINQNLPALTEEDWKICEEMCAILKPFEEVTCKLSGVQYSTGSQMIVLTNCLTAVCKKMIKGNFSKISQSVLQNLLDGIQNKLGDIEANVPVALCTMLDPRFKLIGFSNSDLAEKTKNILIGKVRDHLVEETSLSPEVYESTSVSEDTTNNEFSVWEEFEKKAADSHPQALSNSEAVVEVERYLNEKLIPRNQDPLQWWKKHHHLYPTIGKTAQENFCIVASSIPCERVFSKAGNFVSEKRSHLSRKHTKQLIFLNANHKLMLKQ